MDEPIINRAALRTPQNRRLLIILGASLLALLLVLALWQSTGTRGARRNLAGATERVAEKQREVDEARRQLEAKLAELRAVRAEADVEATRLGGAVDARVGDVIDDARADAGTEYYVRNRDGEFVRVTRP
jgi:F0F1-type ATP synthase membrane subunit b/b'